MKITVIRKPFLASLAKASKITPNNPIVPALSNAHLKFSGSNLVVTSSNMSTTMSQKVANCITEIQDDYFACIEPKTVADYISQVNDDTIQLDFIQNAVVISHAKGNMKIPTIDANEFPKVEYPLEQCSFEIPQNEFCEAIAKLSKTAIPDTLNNRFNSFFVEKSESGVNFVQIHGHIFQLNDIKLSDVQDFETFGIFISEFKSVASVLSSNSTENLMIHVLDNKVLFETEDLTISTTRLDEKMPDYNSVLPKYSDSLIVGRLALKNAVKMASTAIGNVGKELALKIDVSDMETKLSIQDIDFGQESTETIESESTQGITFGINPKLLLNAIDCLIADKVKIEFSQPNRPFIFTNYAHDNTDLIFIGAMMLR